MERTLDIVQRDRGAVEALADALVKRGYVDGVEAERIVRAARTLTISSGRATP
jgi:hypothetical protein